MAGRVRRAALAAALAASLAPAAAQAPKGPFADRAVVEARPDAAACVAELAGGGADLVIGAVGAAAYRALPEADRAGLAARPVDTAAVSLIVNPCPDAPPYLAPAGVDGGRFNPLAVRELRRALGRLLDRESIAREALGGDASPSFSPPTPRRKGDARLDLVPARLGLPSSGDLAGASADIDAAMRDAARSPRLAGRLSKEGGRWTFDGRPVLIKILGEPGGSEGRPTVGRHVAERLESAGLAAELVELDRLARASLVRSSDPASLEWQISVEEWEAGAFGERLEPALGLAYAPCMGAMPGNGASGAWSYRSPELDRLALLASEGGYATEDEFRAGGERLLELALGEGVRIFLAARRGYALAAASRLSGPVPFGPGAGMGSWALRGADPKPAENGGKRLTALAPAAEGAFLAAPWNPAGASPVGDPVRDAVLGACTDAAGAFESPDGTGPKPILASWSLSALETGARRGRGGEPARGILRVNPRALVYDSRARRWSSGLEYLDAGSGRLGYESSDDATARAKLAYSPRWPLWHHGRRMTAADALYATAFRYEWSNLDGGSDRAHDPAFESRNARSLASLKGLVLGRDGSIVTYFDRGSPSAGDRRAAAGLLPIAAEDGGPLAVPWEILEAASRLVLDGGASGRSYGFGPGPSKAEIDLVDPACAADIRAALAAMLAENSVPPSISRWATAEEAADRYASAMEFIDRRGHAYVSNGPYVLASIDRRLGRVELEAFRDYQYRADYWPRALSARQARIDGIDFPSPASRKEDLRVVVAASSVAYPAGTAKPADDLVRVLLTLAKADGTALEYGARILKAGLFEATIPAKDLAGLGPTDRAFVVEAWSQGEYASAAFARLEFK